jgi:hypothetical protein
LAQIKDLLLRLVHSKYNVQERKKLALANASRKKQLRQADLAEALTFMRSLPINDAIDLDVAELKNHNFSEAELETLL